MSDNFNITCPYCKEEFDAGSAFKLHLNHTKKEEAKKAEALAAKKYESQLASKEKEIEKTKKEEAKKAEALAAKKYESQLASKEKETSNKINEAKELERKRLTIENTKKLQDKDDELEKMKKSEEILNERLSKKNDEIERMLNQKSMELQGEIQEERLKEYLEKQFPEDDIEDVSKGQKGADCIQTINYKERRNLAKIYFESKDTKVFNEQWANKLLKDMKDKEIANGILVVSPTCLPDDLDKERSYVERHGNVITIIPMYKPIIHSVVNRIRSILIFKSRENKDHEIPVVMKKFFEILNSPSFILPVKDMVNEINNMKSLLEKDKTSFHLSHSKKQKNIESIQDSLTSMILPLMNVDSSIIPESLLIPQEKIKKIKK